MFNEATSVAGLLKKIMLSSSYRWDQIHDHSVLCIWSQFVMQLKSDLGIQQTNLCALFRGFFLTKAHAPGLGMTKFINCHRYYFGHTLLGCLKYLMNPHQWQVC
jgi:hypothetical protein